MAKKTYFSGRIQKEIEDIILELSNQFNLSPKEIREIIVSQFRAVKVGMKMSDRDNANFFGIRLIYLGNFRVSVKKYYKYVRDRQKLQDNSKSGDTSSSWVLLLFSKEWSDFVGT